MEWVETPQSTSISGFGYEAAERRLTVIFNSGQSYRYFDVSPDIFEEFKHAESKGRYFTASVRNNYKFEHIITSASL